MSESNWQLLDEAVARQAGVVLSLPADGNLEHHKSRFLKPGEEGIWLQATTAGSARLAALVGSDRPCGISFRSGDTKVVFGSRLLRHDPNFTIEAGEAIPAVLVARPTQLKAVQKRVNYRVKVPDDFNLSVRVWRMNRQARLQDAPLAAAEVHAKLIDISVAGMGLFLSGDNAPPLISCADRLRIELTYNDQPLLLEGRLRYPKTRPEENTIRGGISFQVMDDSLEGRRRHAALTRIVGELQRLELRRVRLGLE